MLRHPIYFTVILFLAASCCSLASSDDSQAFKVAADLAVAGTSRYGAAVPQSSYGSVSQYQPLPVPLAFRPGSSYGYGAPSAVVPVPKAPKGTKSWIKHMFKGNKGSSYSSALPSYVISPVGPSYRPYNSYFNGGSAYSNRYGAYGGYDNGYGYGNSYGGGYGNGYGNSYGSYGSSYAPNYGSSSYGYANGSPYVAPYGATSSVVPFGGRLNLVQPPLVGSSLYGAPGYGGTFLPGIGGLGGFGGFGGLGGIGDLGLNYGGGFSSGYGYGGYQSSYTPTLFGAFDHYRGPISYGGFRPTIGPYGGQLYSDLLSVTDSYGRPLLPYSSFAKRSSSNSTDFTTTSP